MKNKIFIFAVFLIIAITSIHFVYAVAVTSPHLFYGSLTLNGANAPVGTTVTATIAGTTVGTLTTTAAGLYGGASASEHKLAVTYSTNGAVITFSAGAATCIPTSSFSAGSSINLDLICGEAAGGGTTGTTGSTGGGGTPGGGGGGGGAVTPPPTETWILVTDPTTISEITPSLPDGWISPTVYINPTITITETTTTTPSTIDNALSYATNQDSISELQGLKNDVSSGELTGLTTTETLSVYKVVNPDTGAIEYRTKVDAIFTAPYDLEDVVVIETIPLDMAKSIKDITFIGAQPEVLQGDGPVIVKWTFPSVSKGETKKLGYVLKGKITKLTSVTTATGKKVVPPTPPPEKKKPRLVTAQVVIGLTIMVLIVLIGLIIYYTVTRKKKEK